MGVERKKEGNGTTRRKKTNPETTTNPSTEVIHFVGNLIEENEKKEFTSYKKQKEKSPRRNVPTD